MYQSMKESGGNRAAKECPQATRKNTATGSEQAPGIVALDCEMVGTTTGYLHLNSPVSPVCRLRVVTFYNGISFCEQSVREIVSCNLLASVIIVLQYLHPL